MFDLKSNCQTSCLTALAGEPVADKRRDKIIQPALWQPLTVETLKGVWGNTQHILPRADLPQSSEAHSEDPKSGASRFFPLRAGSARGQGCCSSTTLHSAACQRAVTWRGLRVLLHFTPKVPEVREDPKLPPPDSLYLTPKPGLGFRAGDSNRGPWGAAEERAAARSPPQPPLSPWRRRAGPHGPAA